MRLLKCMFAIVVLYFSANTAFALENSYKLFGIGGTGYTSFSLNGLGFTYAGYIKDKRNEKLLHTFDVNTYFMRIKDYEYMKKLKIDYVNYQANVFVGYGLGFENAQKTKITFDIIGLGVNVTGREDDFAANTNKYHKKLYVKIGNLVNFIGVQATFENGLYIGWRNTFTSYNYRTRENYRNKTSMADEYEFKTLFMIGYNFGALTRDK